MKSLLGDKAKPTWEENKTVDAFSIKELEDALRYEGIIENGSIVRIDNKGRSSTLKSTVPFRRRGKMINIK